MTIERTIGGAKLKFELTPEELREAYQEQLDFYLDLDAKRQVEWFIYGMDKNELTEEEIAEAELALNENCHVEPEQLEGYLPQIVDSYVHSQDCNIAENETWQNAISRLLMSISFTGCAAQAAL